MSAPGLAAVRSALLQAGDTFRYLAKWIRTPHVDRVGLFAPKLAKAPICWFRGHSWERQRSICITNYTLQFCTCCGQEIAFRTSWNSIIARPDDADDPCDDFYDDPSAADWDEAYDRAVGNGGPF